MPNDVEIAAPYEGVPRLLSNIFQRVRDGITWRGEDIAIPEVEATDVHRAMLRPEITPAAAEDLALLEFLDNTYTLMSGLQVLMKNTHVICGSDEGENVSAFIVAKTEWESLFPVFEIVRPRIRRLRSEGVGT